MIAKIVINESQDRFERLALRILREFGCIVAHDTLHAGKFDITARPMVITTGSHPANARIPGLHDVTFLTNKMLFRMKEAPDHLLILGGGPIAIEMLQAHVRMSRKVTLIEAAQILVKDDSEFVDLVWRRLQTDGVDILATLLCKR